ncbi:MULTISPECIES: SDR family NAD(P)-dependent oxidoreductase [unclassified Novosphingobium]|uniref:SDR family NAD(P)-dependent oxidoreductase n=1 Tax=unclassified Novosphingobium TaxID=2644732 RepID=UPI0013577C26|nr:MULTISPECIES: SDR family NAD(P)-dependent oxidoreductase [unclassified Novosphingobium]
MARYCVIGGAGGVGSALVSALVQAGHSVAVSVLNANEAAAVAAAHSDVAAFELDLSNPAQVADTLRAGVGEGPLDGVAVCAALAPIGVLETADIAQAARTLDVNVLSALAIYQAVMPQLRASKGRLAMVSSMAGKVAMPFVGVYSASKFALEGIADVMRREAAPQGVSVSLVEPGGIKTPMVDAQLAQVARMIDELDTEQDRLYGAFHRGFQAAAHASHVGGASTPEEVAAKLVAALTDASPQPRYVAGADAEQLIGAGRALGDAEMDAVMAQMILGETV